MAAWSRSKPSPLAAEQFGLEPRPLPTQSRLFQGEAGAIDESERTKGLSLEAVTDWWETAITDIAPGSIRVRGYAIEDLIGTISFPAMIWLMLRGELPARAEADLLEAALVPGVDHGPHAPSIAISRMAVTCGLPLNGAMASAINVLDDVHGGAGQQCMELYPEVDAEAEADGNLVEAATRVIERRRAAGEKRVPGFGHRFHPVDPRAPRLLEVTRDFAARGVVSGRFADIAEAIEAEIARRKGRTIPLNIDGATAVIYGELGFPPPLTRGLFVLSRSVGILAHAWEQTQQGGRNKGPIPRSFIPTYGGHAARPMPAQEQ